MNEAQRSSTAALSRLCECGGECGCEGKERERDGRWFGGALHRALLGCVCSCIRVRVRIAALVVVREAKVVVVVVVRGEEVGVVALLVLLLCDRAGRGHGVWP